MIKQLKQYDSVFTKNHSHGDENTKETFIYNDCGSPLILSAPHATASFVNKKEKKADLHTGALVKYLGEISNTSTLIRTKYTPYKELISDYVTEHHLQEHYFLDIHGFNQTLDFDICLGTGEFDDKDYPYLEEIISTAKKYRLKVIINHPNYMGKIGLTGRFQRTYKKPNIIQIELNMPLRNFYTHSDIVENITVPFFLDIIELYKK